VRVKATELNNLNIQNGGTENVIKSLGVHSSPNRHVNSLKFMRLIQSFALLLFLPTSCPLGLYSCVQTLFDVYLPCSACLLDNSVLSVQLVKLLGTFHFPTSA
jgi:hypothetical protein